MKTIETKSKAIAQIHASLIEGSDLENRGKKMRELAKAQLAGVLSEKNIDIDALAVGEAVLVKYAGKDCITVEIGERAALDQKTLQLENPTIFAKYYKKNPVQYVKPNKGFSAT